MKALRLDDLLTFSYVDVPDPAVGDEDVLLAVRACGICGSDVHGYDGASGRRTPPLIMGHEAAGVVVRTGSEVTGWHPGDRVTFESTLSCGACPACLAGRSNLCEHREVVGASFSGYRRDGAFAEHVAVPGRALVRLPDELTFERAAFAEPLAVALHAVGLAGDVAGATAAVVGTGVIGLLAVQALRLAGAARVIGIDLDEQRLELARRLGADVTVRADDEQLGGGVAEATGGRGADVVVEAVGIAAAIRTAVACAGRGSRIVLVGNVTPAVELPLQAVVTGELTLVGSCASAGELEDGLELLASGAVDVDPLISAVAPLAEGQVWFDRLHAATHGLVKVILTPPNGKG
jgi:L-iditol 2-dehydrogenase